MVEEVCMYIHLYTQLILDACEQHIHIYICACVRVYVRVYMFSRLGL